MSAAGGRRNLHACPRFGLIEALEPVVDAHFPVDAVWFDRLAQKGDLRPISLLGERRTRRGAEGAGQQRQRLKPEDDGKKMWGKKMS
ncbi:MAG TPA: hypothetical protein VFX03_07445, partial [Thermomicrobiales bacterium]|nr:hypothetical protein [Thermomicrobiales bacterium]